MKKIEINLATAYHFSIYFCLNEMKGIRNFHECLELVIKCVFAVILSFGKPLNTKKLKILSN